MSVLILLSDLWRSMGSASRASRATGSAAAAPGSEPAPPTAAGAAARARSTSFSGPLSRRRRGRVLRNDGVLGLKWLR